MTWGLMKATIILPGTVLVFAPTVVLFVSRGTRFSPDLHCPTELAFFLAMAIAAVGGYMAVRTATIFIKYVDGPPASWEPPKKLVRVHP